MFKPIVLIVLVIIGLIVLVSFLVKRKKTEPNTCPNGTPDVDNKRLCKCPDCGSMVSKSSKRCPNCGRKMPHTPVGCLTVLAIVVIVAIAIPLGKRAEEKRVAKMTPSERALYDEQNSPSDDLKAQIYIKNYLEENLNDRKSYESIEFSELKSTANGGYMMRHKYRAKNMLGGYVLEEQVFYFDEYMNIYKVEDL